jgi:hypothetical protein
MNLSCANKTFMGGEPTWANACVGDNGAPGLIDYAEGFASAANALLDSAIADQGINLPVDTLVYPVCFTMRHAIELFLKKFAVDLAEIRSLRGDTLPTFSKVASHDLGLIWVYVKVHALATDERLVAHVNGLDEYITDVAGMDATGQVFRYPSDLENKKHLTSIGIINFVVLKLRFNQIQLLLEELNRTVVDLNEEYRWGTFTRSLSRLQLRKLAADLPARSRWREACFGQVRDDLKAKYKVSSRELSKAIKLIQRRHEMAAFIGASVPIPGLSVAALERFFDKWCALNDLQLVINPPQMRIVSSTDIEAALRDDLCRQELGNTLATEINPDEYAAIKALFYFEDEAPVSEAFERILVIHQREADGYKSNLAAFQQSLRDMMRKSRTFERILYSLDFLGQTETLEAIIQRYGLEPARARLLEKSTFRKAVPV